MWLSNLTNWGLLVKNFTIQLQREVLVFRSLSLVISLEGVIALDAKLKERQSHICVTVAQVGEGRV